MSILDFPVYVINLKRSTDKKARMETRLKNAGFTDVKFIEALQPGDNEVEFYAQNKNPWTNLGQWYKDLACFGSHLKALKTLIDSDAGVALICEDDILFHNEFATIANDLISLINSASLLSFTYMISEPIDQTYIVRLDKEPEPGVIWHSNAPISECIYYGLWRIDNKATWGAQCYLIDRNWAEKIYSDLHRPVTNAISSEAIILRSGGLMTSVPLVLEDNISSDRAPQDSPFHLRHFSRWNYNNYNRSDPDRESPLARMNPTDSWPGYPFKKE
jgi:GR25 family glycosyltransferase involved in LPS biosynthesis